MPDLTVAVTEAADSVAVATALIAPATEPGDVVVLIGGVAAAFAVLEDADSLLIVSATIPPGTEPGDILVFAANLRLPAVLALTEAPDRIVLPLAPGWPTPLPLPTLQGYAFRPDQAVERRPVEIGAPRVYRRTKKPPVEVAVGWQLDADQQALLDGFQTATLQQGGQWFGITLAFPSGLGLAVARFKDKVATKARGGPRWQTTATLELLAWPTMSEAALTALLDDAGDPPAWPSTLLPAPTLDGWELTPQPATIRTDDLPGLPQQRQRSRNGTTEVPAAWELSASQAALFDGFFRWRGRDGAQWFSFPLVQAIGTDATMVRFLGTADWTPRGEGRWGVSAGLEIRERRSLSAADVTQRLIDA